MFKNSVQRYSTGISNKLVFSTLLLSRNPVITRDLPEFESQYYKYQNELWKRLMWTFPKWFYYRPGTLGEQNFNELNTNPVYNNPNLEFVHGRPEIRHQRDRRFKQELSLPKTFKTNEQGEEIIDEDSGADNLSRRIVPNSRITEADKKNDLSSLTRKLSRSLYLIISKDESKTWEFPKFKMSNNNENDIVPLHKVAENGLYDIGGEQINYYNVSSKPCHLIHNGDDHEFFIKSHIVSGLFTPQEASIQYLWVTKDELKQYLNQDYYNNINHLLNDV